jgi:cytochrome c551/c552
MEMNREEMKEYLFNKGMSNVAAFNKPYESAILHKKDCPICHGTGYYTIGGSFGGAETTQQCVQCEMKKLI